MPRWPTSAAPGMASIEIDGDVRRKRGILTRGTAVDRRRPGGTCQVRAHLAAQVRRYEPNRVPIETGRQDGVEKGNPVVIEMLPGDVISWGR